MPAPKNERRSASAARAWTDADLEAYAVRYVARFDCTEQRLRKVLTTKLAATNEAGADTSGESLDRLIDRFKELGYINDRRYAERLVESLRLRGASTRKIRERLRERGVGAPMVSELLAEGRTNSQEDFVAAVKWVKRRRIGPHRPPEQQRARYQRDLAALARAGFSFDVARRALAVTTRAGAIDDDGTYEVYVED